MIWDPPTWKRESSAGFLARRTNPILKEIDRLVEAYHKVGATDSEAYLKRTAFLAAIYSRTRVYLTQHRDKEARRAAVSTLMGQAKQELKQLKPPVQRRTPGELLRRAVQIHGRMNVGGGFRPSIPMHDHGYMLEAFGQSHFAADAMKEQFEKWIEKHAKAESGEGVAPPNSFWQWLEQAGFATFAKHIVYLTPEERADYRVAVGPAGLSWASGGGPVHTMSTVQTEVFDAESYIFVLSPDKELYAGETIQGEFHHSSFLGGTPVLGAGQIQVDKGVLLKVTNVSGHYKPDLSRHYNTLLFFKLNGLDLAKIQSKAMGFQPEEAPADQHLTLLQAKLDKVTTKWKMDPAKKLELFRAMEPQAQKKFLAERGMTAAEYEASLAFGPAGATGAPLFRTPAKPTLDQQAKNIFGESRSTGAPQFLPPKPL